jgi:hypothetical protein
MFLLYHSEGCNICELILHECYINDLYTTTYSGMLGHHNLAPPLRGRERAPMVVKMLCVGDVFWEKIRMRRCVLKMKI